MMLMRKFVSSSTGAQLWNYDGTGHVNIDKPFWLTEGSNSMATVGGIMSDYGKFRCVWKWCCNWQSMGNRTYSSTTWYQSGAVYVYN